MYEHSGEHLDLIPEIDNKKPGELTIAPAAVTAAVTIAAVTIAAVTFAAVTFAAVTTSAAVNGATVDVTFVTPFITPRIRMVTLVTTTTWATFTVCAPLGAPAVARMMKVVMIMITRAIQ